MKIRTCPFCGGEIERHRDTYYIDHESSCFLFRNHVNFINKNELEAWNRREPIDRIVEQLEELKYKPCADTKNCTDFVTCKQHFMQKAIEIVKSGGAV